MSFSFQVLMVLALAVGIVPLISSCNQANNPPVYFQVISGEVTASDGNTYSDASDGKKIPLNARTQIKTDSQVATIQLWNGSVVILDSETSIEFNRPNEHEPEMSFAFNLLKGRVLVINEKNRQISIRIFIGSNFIVQASQAAMGLEVFADSKNLDEVDCLVGNCLVNGIHLLMAGQNAQIGPGELVQVTEGASIDEWMSLWEASNLKRKLTNLLVSFMPTTTPRIKQTLPLINTAKPYPTLTSNKLIQSPTPLLVVLQNMTPSLTSSPSPSPTLTPSRTIKPFRFPTFTKTLSQVNDPAPSKTLTPSLTLIPPPTSTQTPTPTLIPTNTPLPSDTSSPTPTSTSVPTWTSSPVPTWTSSPVPTVTSTNIPVSTETDLPQPTPTEEPPPTPTDDD